MRNIYDWEQVEREYQVGQKSLRALSAEFGPTPGAISKRASKLGWVQDLTVVVRQRTRAALLKETLNGNTRGNTSSREDVDRAVETNIAIIRGHRQDIQKCRALVAILYTQLKEAAESRQRLEADIVIDTEDAKLDLKRRHMMMKAVALPSHAAVIRDLSVALKNLIGLERQAFGLDAELISIDEVLSAAEKINPALAKAMKEVLKNG